MPERQTLQRVQRDKREGKAPSTQAGEFIREEFHHVREGKHGARSPRQAIAIGLSKARRSGVELPPPSASQTSDRTSRRAARDLERGQGAAPRRRATGKRRAASRQALAREPRASASPRAIGAQTRASAARRTPTDRAAAARKAARTKGPERRSAAARKAAQTRAERAGARRGSASRASHATRGSMPGRHRNASRQLHL